MESLEKARESVVDSLWLIDRKANRGDTKEAIEEAHNLIVLLSKLGKVRDSVGKAKGGR